MNIIWSRSRVTLHAIDQDANDGMSLCKIHLPNNARAELNNIITAKCFKCLNTSGQRPKVRCPVCSNLLLPIRYYYVCSQGHEISNIVVHGLAVHLASHPGAIHQCRNKRCKSIASLLAKELISYPDSAKVKAF